MDDDLYYGIYLFIARPLLNGLHDWNGKAIFARIEKKYARIISVKRFWTFSLTKIKKKRFYNYFIKELIKRVFHFLQKKKLSTFSS